MPKRKESSAPASRGRRIWVDPDDAPEITDEMLDRAEIVVGGKVIQRGRPPLGEAAKVRVALRLDPDVLAAYKRSGTGWQSRINADLRRVQKLKKRA